MPTYVALLRGITPSNPNMSNEKLRAVLESLGLRNVRSVISSGNILFESRVDSVTELEAMIEVAWPEQLGSSCTTIIRSHTDLQELIAKKPFGNRGHGPHTALNVTFLKRKPAVSSQVYTTKNDTIVHIYDREVCTAIDRSTTKTPQLMSALEKLLGKEITTRTWKTVLLIARKMSTSV